MCREPGFAHFGGVLAVEAALDSAHACSPESRLQAWAVMLRALGQSVCHGDNHARHHLVTGAPCGAVQDSSDCTPVAIADATRLPLAPSQTVRTDASAAFSLLWFGWVLLVSASISASNGET